MTRIPFKIDPRMYAPRRSRQETAPVPNHPTDLDETHEKPDAED